MSRDTKPSDYSRTDFFLFCLRHAAAFNTRDGAILTGAIPTLVGAVLDHALSEGKVRIFMTLLGGPAAIPGALLGLLTSPIKAGVTFCARDYKHQPTVIKLAFAGLKDLMRNQSIVQNNNEALESMVSKITKRYGKIKFSTSDSSKNLLEILTSSLPVDQKIRALTRYMLDDNMFDDTKMEKHLYNNGKKLFNIIFDVFSTTNIMTEISEPTAASSLPKKNRPMFFKPTRPPLTKPKESMSFQERLDLIGYEGEVPENYIDPITSCIMDVPCNTNSNTGTKIYDQQTLKNLQTNYAGRDPFNPGSPLAFKDINVSLQEDIARFVSNKEEEYQALKFPKI